MINDNEPFVKYCQGDKLPKGFVINRTYLNYSSFEARVLTETDLAEDLAIKYLECNTRIEIVDTNPNKESRPNTATTAKDAAKKIIEKVKNGFYDKNAEVKVLFQSNQPFIERQALAAQRAVDYELKENGIIDFKVQICGVSYANKQSVPVVHSELGALMYEKYLLAIQSGLLKTFRDLRDIQFSTRSKEPTTKPMP